MEEKKNKMLKLILKVLAIFIGFELIVQTFGAILGQEIYNTINFGKYGRVLITEASVFIFSLLFLLLTKKWYIFKKVRVKFKEGINYGLPLLLISLVMLFSSIISISDSVNVVNLLSLIFYTILIGCFEEVFFRGIILETLIEDAKTRKQVIISIVISAVIFGLTHFTNLLVGQDLLTTFMQVIQTFAIGVLLGSVYYLSRNIWVVIFLHSFYDFSIMLSDVNLIKDCTLASDVPFSLTFNSLIISLFFSAIYIFYSVSLLRKSKINNCLNIEVLEEDKVEDDRKDKNVNKVIWLLIIFMFGFNIIYNLIIPIDQDDYYICYEFKEITIDKIETHYYAYDEYETVIDNVNYRVFLENDKAYIQNLVTQEIKDLGYEDVLRVVLVDNNLIIITYDFIDYVVYYVDINNINIKEKYQKYDISDVAQVGYLIDATTEDKYPLIKSETSDLFIIKDNELMIVKKG